MNSIRRAVALFLGMSLSVVLPSAAEAEQPVAIFHAFNQPYAEVTRFVCNLADQGYSHVQISPAQKSNPASVWYARYQPVDYSVIEGLGSEAELKALVDQAHSCKVGVIADVVFNHMANMDEYANLAFPRIGPAQFHPRCIIDYSKRQTVVNCRLGACDTCQTPDRGLPDLNQADPKVRDEQLAHLKKLIDLGVDGFRFDAAKHMPADALRDYIKFINENAQATSWNYLEVIEDDWTQARDYNGIAAVTDFVLYKTMKSAFTYGGDLKTLRVPVAVDDARSVTFGRLHDNLREISSTAIDPYDDKTDSYLATAYVLARQSGTPLVLNWDNADSAIIRTGVKFRQIMHQRGTNPGVVKENVRGEVVKDKSATLLFMERGAEGFFVVNKATEPVDVPALELTSTSLEGCYRELRNDFLVAVERRQDGKKWVTRWGTWSRGGMQVHGRDALFFIREPWEVCLYR